jgi:alpha-beta hydrolase superfamily lysophospholipase
MPRGQAAIAIMLVALIALCLSAGTRAARATEAFYRWTEEVPSNPGEILRSEPFPGAPEGAKAWRVLYSSTGPDGKPVAVSGVIIAPDGPAGAERRRVVAWAHPTTGVAQGCAPSLAARFAFGRTPGLRDFLARGFVVAATDYPGLGTPGPHPYLVGTSEARAVLDSVRAAARFADVEASDTFAVWGHSQGGHAALFAGLLARSYAPELKLAGVAAAAPATDLATLLEDDLASPVGKVLASFALWSWHLVYDASLSPLMDTATEAAMNRVAAECIEDVLEGLVVRHREKAIDRNFRTASLTAVEPWKSLLERNTPASAGFGAPLYISQGSADQVVRPQVTVDWARSACRAGAPVRFDWREGLTHKQAGEKSAAAAAEWIAARFAGNTPPSDCGDLPEPQAANP